MIFRILVEEQPRECPHDESITFTLMDIKNAYPNVPWSLCWTVLEKLGLPPRMMNTTQRLNRKTLYLVRTRMVNLQRSGSAGASEKGARAAAWFLTCFTT